MVWYLHPSRYAPLGTHRILTADLSINLMSFLDIRRFHKMVLADH